MGFSEYDVTRRTRKGNFLKQIDQLIDWNSIEKAMAVYYAPLSDATGRPAYPGLLLFKMLLIGIWNGGLSDESVEDMANSNLQVMRFLGIVVGRRCAGSFRAVRLSNPADGGKCVEWVVSPSECANTSTRYHGQARLPCRCEHYAESA